MHRKINEIEIKIDGELDCKERYKEDASKKKRNRKKGKWRIGFVI